MKPGFLYYIISGIMFLVFGTFLAVFYRPNNSLLGTKFFSIFGIVLIVVACVRCFKAYQLFKKK